MSDPRLALWLYVAIVAVQVLYSQKWQDFYSLIASAGAAKVEATAGDSQDSGAGQHGL